MEILLINTYIKIFFAISAFLVALYSTLYSYKTYEVRKKFPIPLSSILSKGVKYNLIISWTAFIIILELLLVA